jgi:hypothetical protein
MKRLAEDAEDERADQKMAKNGQKWTKMEKWWKNGVSS